jgi:type I restriction enzyme R subunit
VAELTKPPFDKPRSFIKLFDGDKQERIVRIINEIRDNAVRVVG